MGEDLSDEEIEAIHDAAINDAEQAWGVAGAVGYKNPYHHQDQRAEIYDFAFRNAYAKGQGY